MTIKKLIGIVLLIVFIAIIISTIKQNILEDFYETHMYTYRVFHAMAGNPPFILSIVARAGTMILISTFITCGLIFLSAFSWAKFLMKDDLIGTLEYFGRENGNIGEITFIPLNDSTGGFFVSPQKKWDLWPYRSLSIPGVNREIKLTTFVVLIIISIIIFLVTVIKDYFMMTKYRNFVDPSLWWLFVDSILVSLIFLMGAWTGRDIIKRKITLTWNWNIGWERNENPIVIDNFVFIACDADRVTLALPVEIRRGMPKYAKEYLKEHYGHKILNKVTEELFEKYRPNIENVLSTDS